MHVRLQIGSSARLSFGPIHLCSLYTYVTFDAAHLIELEVGMVFSDIALLLWLRK